MKILKTYARLWVTDLDESLPLYEAMVGEPAHLRFGFEEATLGAVGDFLLIAGAPEATDRYRGTVGPVIVDDLDAAEAMALQHGAVVLGDRVNGPTGELFYARFPDGVQIEYLQFTRELVERVVDRTAAVAP